MSLLTLIFSGVFAFFFMAPPFLSGQFGGYPLMKIGDVVDIATPLALVPLYWLLLRLDRSRPLHLKESIPFLILVVFWVEGQGMHLAANSIGHLLGAAKGGDAYNLTSFYDEVLGHYLWHFGIVGLSALLLIRQWRNPFAEVARRTWLPVVAGIIHGFTFFVIVIEAGTAPLGVPFAALVVLFGLVRGRNRFRRQPLLLFFFVAYLAATLFFAGWALYWRGLPQFSQVGIIE